MGIIHALFAISSEYKQNLNRLPGFNFPIVGDAFVFTRNEKYMGPGLKSYLVRRFNKLGPC